MISKRIIEGADFFKAISLQHRSLIESEFAVQNVGLYELNLGIIPSEKQIYHACLEAFSISVPFGGGSPGWDSCADILENSLAERAEANVVLAVLNVEVYLATNLQQFLNLLDFLRSVGSNMLLAAWVPPCHRVRLRVLFYGTGINYP